MTKEICLSRITTPLVKRKGEYGNIKRIFWFARANGLQRNEFKLNPASKRILLRSTQYRQANSAAFWISYEKPGLYSWSNNNIFSQIPRLRAAPPKAFWFLLKSCNYSAIQRDLKGVAAERRFAGLREY